MIPSGPSDGTVRWPRALKALDNPTDVCRGVGLGRTAPLVDGEGSFFSPVPDQCNDAGSYSEYEHICELKRRHHAPPPAQPL